MEAQQTWPSRRTARSSSSTTTAPSWRGSPAPWRCAASRCAPRRHVPEGLPPVRRRPPAFAVVDMRLEDGNGLDVIAALQGRAARCARRRADRLRQYRHRRDGGEARRRRLSRQAGRCRRRRSTRCSRPATHKAPPPENPMSADRVRWEHIQRVYELCNRNVSETARRLNMHRRTLQRILAKRAPK